MRGSHLSIVTHPELLIVEGGDRLGELQHTLKQAHLPCIDINVILDHVVDCIFEYRSVEDELLHLTSTLLDVEALGSGPVRHERGHRGRLLEPYDELDPDVLTVEDIGWKAVRVGIELKHQFRQLRLFEEEYLRYQHSRIIGDRTIILRRRRR